MNEPLSRARGQICDGAGIFLARLGIWPVPLCAASVSSLLASSAFQWPPLTWFAYRIGLAAR